MKKTKSTKILVIENSLSDVQLVKGLLRQSSRHPFYVLTAHTLSQGLALLSASSVDAIILDLRLPDSQGLDTLLTIREQASHLPIIVLIVPGDDALGERALEEGAQRFLSKDALTLGVPYAPIFTRTIRFAIKQKQEQTELQKAREEMGALNKQLEATNEALEQRVQERTEELALMNEELQSTNEELRVANEEFQHETTQRARAEKTTRQNAERTAILNEVIHVLNEAPDLPSLYERALSTILEQLKCESGLIATVSDTGRLTVDYAYNHEPAFIKAINGLNVDDNSFTRALYQRQEVV
ncbi:MAG: response regulator, partial [Halobacteriota archaeon]